MLTNQLSTKSILLQPVALGTLRKDPLRFTTTTCSEMYKTQSSTTNFYESKDRSTSQTFVLNQHANRSTSLFLSQWPHSTLTSTSISGCRAQLPPTVSYLEGEQKRLRTEGGTSWGGQGSPSLSEPNRKAELNKRTGDDPP